MSDGRRDKINYTQNSQYADLIRLLWSVLLMDTICPTMHCMKDNGGAAQRYTTLEQIVDFGETVPLRSWKTKE